MKHLSLKVHEKLMSYFDIKVDYNNDYLITTLTLMDNPRELKHVLNDVLLIPLEFIQAVHYADLISIINIQNNNLELYNLIYENQSYFISEQDRTLELITNIKAKELNKKSKEFFDECSKNKFWQKDLILLKEMFPNVKKYYEDNHNYYQISKEKKLESEKNRRISNFRYFSIYFNKVSNDFHKVSLAAEKLVENLKKSSFEEQFLDIIIDVEKMNSFDQLLFLESMDIYANEYLIDEEFDNLIVLLEIIYPSLDDSIQYFVPKPRQMSYIYISTYLSKLSNEVFDKRIKEMFENYDNLYLLFIIEQDVASESINGFPNKNYNLKRAETINELFEMKINEIINNNIDLYNNEYTIKGSALVPYLKYKEKNFDKVKKYYEKIINEKNINKFLFDMATEGYDGKYYSYSIKVEEVHEILNQHLIEKHITRAEKTKENLEIFDIYNKSKTIKDLTFQAAKKYIKPLKFFSP